MSANQQSLGCRKSSLLLVTSATISLCLLASSGAMAVVMAQPSDRSPANSPVRLPPVDPQAIHHAAFLSPIQASCEREFRACGSVEKHGTNRAWKVGQWQIRPYGAFWADMIYATERTFTGQNTLWVLSRDDQGEDAFTVDARRSRLGLEFSGPDLPVFGGAESSGRVEIDFLGQFITENRAGVLLRHFYWEAKTSEVRLLVGQSWDVISPLNPGTLNYAVGLNAGNIGFRRAQFRAERYLAFSDNLLIEMQASLNQDIVTDFPTEPGIRRETSDWPVVQARIGMKLGNRLCDADPITLGVSGHIGETGFDFLTTGPPPLNLPPDDDTRFKTWSFNVDLRVPISDRFGMQGEFFTGANLSAFLGGIGQGVCPCLRVPIRSTGGWFELWYYWTTRLHSHTGYGLDDPNNRDSSLGRVYNQFIFANIVFDVTSQFTTGLEVTYWKTHYQELRVGQVPVDQLTPSAPGKSVTINWMVKYAF